MLNSSAANLFKDDRTILIVTVGNTLRHDDGIGPYIAEQIRNSNIEILPLCGIPQQLYRYSRSGRNNIKILNTNDKPENAIEEAVKIRPAKTIIIDAADFGGKVGEARIIDKEHIPQTTLSTHTFPLPIIAKMIEEDTGSPVFFLGIQPARMDLGEGLSPEVEKTAKEIIKLCMKCTC